MLTIFGNRLINIIRSNVNAISLNGKVASINGGAGKIPLSNNEGKINNSYLNTGHGHGIDADTLDGSHASFNPSEKSIPIADVHGKLNNSYLRTGHENGIDADKLDGFHATDFVKKSENELDTWKIVTLGSGWTHGEGQSLKYRKTRDNYLHLFGTCYTNNVTSDMTKLPEGYWPMRILDLFVQSAEESLVFTIKADGSIYFNYNSPVALFFNNLIPLNY